MSNFDWASLAKYVDQDSKRKYIKEWLDACPEDDPIFLSDVLLRAQHEGLPVMMELGAREAEAKEMSAPRQKWTICSVRDKWGNVLGKGDEVIKINKRTGKSTAQERNTAILDGSYAQKYELHVPYKLDDKGCFEASFTDAAYFLLNYGLHGKSGLTLTTKKEQSGEPMDTPNGSKLHVWYWRFKEVDSGDYKKLKRRGKRDKPLRGLDDLDEIKEHNDAAAAVHTDAADASTAVN